MGVNMQPGLGNAGQAQAPEEWELTALRLMANGSRMEMLHAMAERPMSGQELAQKLNLNSGSVFRDLNSLYNARLLLMESTGGRNCYRTNLPVVRNMMERMLNYLQNQGVKTVPFSINFVPKFRRVHFSVVSLGRSCYDIFILRRQWADGWEDTTWNKQYTHFAWRASL